MRQVEFSEWLEQQQLRLPSSENIQIIPECTFLREF